MNVQCLLPTSVGRNSVCISCLNRKGMVRFAQQPRRCGVPVGACGPRRPAYRHDSPPQGHGVASRSRRQLQRQPQRRSQVARRDDPVRHDQSTPAHLWVALQVHLARPAIASP